MSRRGIWQPDVLQHWLCASAPCQAVTSRMPYALGHAPAKKLVTDCPRPTHCMLLHLQHETFPHI